MFLLHRLSLSRELKKAPTPPAQHPPPPATPAPPQPQVSSLQCSKPPWQLLIFETRTRCVFDSCPLASRCSEEEKQMGLGHPSDPGPAHHHHHHCHAARGGLRDDHCRRHQDHGHLGGGHHPEEGQAVKRPEPEGWGWGAGRGAPPSPPPSCMPEDEERGRRNWWTVCKLTQKPPPDQNRRPSFLWDPRSWLWSNLKRSCF